MIWITSYDDGNIEPYAALTRQNKIDYCLKHRYSYMLPSGDRHFESGLSPAWKLVAVVRQAFERSNEGDWIMLLGADACIIDMDFDLETFIAVRSQNWEASLNAPAPFDLLATRDKNGLNTNGLLFRNCAWTRDLVERWWAMRGATYEVVGPDATHHWWEEQAALIYLVGEPEFTHRSKGRSEIVYVDLARTPPMPDATEHVRLLPQETINGYPPEVYGDYYKEPVFVAHLPGKKTEERTYFIKRALGLMPRVPLPQAHWIDSLGNIRPPQ